MEQAEEQAEVQPSSASARLQKSIDDVVGFHRFAPHQLTTLHNLQRAVECCGRLNVVLAVTDAIQGLLVMTCAAERITRVGVPYGQLASVLHDSSMAFLLLRVATSLQSLGDDGNHMPHVMQAGRGLHGGV